MPVNFFLWVILFIQLPPCYQIWIEILYPKTDIVSATLVDTFVDIHLLTVSQ